MDKLLFNPVRLKIVSTLLSVDNCDFNYLKKITDTTSGNLSIQIKRLKEKKYIKVEKTFENNIFIYLKRYSHVLDKILLKKEIKSLIRNSLLLKVNEYYILTEKGKNCFEKFFQDLLSYKI